MNFKFAWLVVLLLSLFGGAFAVSCPAGYSAEHNKCVSERPIHGSCKPGSKYQPSINKCVLE